MEITIIQNIDRPEHSNGNYRVPTPYFPHNDFMILRIFAYYQQPTHLIENCKLWLWGQFCFEVIFHLDQLFTSLKINFKKNRTELTL